MSGSDRNAGEAPHPDIPMALEPTDGLASVQGMQFLVPSATQSSVSRRILATGATEPAFTEVIKRLVVQGAQVIDIGANIGYFTCILAKCAGPSGRVLAFEPVERPRAYLQRNVELNDFTAVEVDARALADWSGAGFMTLPAYRLQAAVTGRERAAFEVEVERLDRISGQLGVGCPDLVKIDIEGAELRALEGMEELLAATRPIVAVEVHPTLLGLYDDSIDALHGFLSRLQYSWTRVEPEATPEANYHLVAAPHERFEAVRILAEP